MADKSPKQFSILIVDDEPVVRDSLSKWFRQDGYRVETAEDAAHALRLMDKGPWDVILLDIKMPGMSGLDSNAAASDASGKSLYPGCLSLAAYSTAGIDAAAV